MEARRRVDPYPPVLRAGVGRSTEGPLPAVKRPGPRPLFIATPALRGLLFALGHAMAAISHVDPATRRRITRDLVIEISSDDGPARHWVFDRARRSLSTRGGHAPRVDAAFRFSTSGQALRTLLSPHAIGRIFEGLQAETMRWEGNLLLMLWFYGLTRRIAPIGRQHRLWRRLPHAYVAHDPSSPAARFITVEPPERELDRGWTNAWEQRAKLLIVRVVDGEPAREF